MTYKAFVINLDGSEARMRSVESSLNAQNISFVRIPAIDGRNVTPNAFKEYDDKKAKKYYGRSLSGPEVACYLSHLKALRSFIESGEEVGVIFEDDVKIDNDFDVSLDAAIKELKNQRPPWGLIHFRPRRWRYRTFIANILSRTLYQLHKFPVHTGGIAYSRSGALITVEGADTIYAPWDIYLKDVIAKHDNGFGLVPELIHSARLQSDISPPTGRRGEISGVLGWLRKQRRTAYHEVCGLRNKLRNIF